MSETVFFKFFDNIPRDTLVYISYLIISMVFWCIRHRYLKLGLLLYSVCFLIKLHLNKKNDQLDKAYLIGICLLIMVYYEDGSIVKKPWVFMYMGCFLLHQNNLINYILNTGLFYLIYRLGYFKELK